MYKKIITMLFIFNLSLISAQGKEIEKKNNTTENIVIFNLTSNKKSKKYNYYTTIIPHTIGKNLKKDKEFNIIRNVQKIQKVKNHKSRIQVSNFLKKIKSLGLEKKKYDYIIVGECNIIEDKDEKVKTNKLKEISITIQIIDVRTKKAINFTETSKEVGAIFQKTVDKLSKKISTSMTTLKRYHSSSSIMKFHNLMSNVNIGIKGGRAFMVGKFKDPFNDAVLIGPYILIHPIKWIGISANFDYFSTKTEREAPKINKDLTVYDCYFALHAIVPMKMFDISLSAGMGVTFSRIHIDDPLTPMNPFSYTNTNKKRTDYSVNADFSFNYNISILRLSIGTNYKVIFFNEDKMQILSVVLGLGFRF